jgi:hypothetical protein
LNPAGGAGGADTTGLWVRKAWLLDATERGWNAVKAFGFPEVPGAPDEYEGAGVKVLDLRDGGAAVDGGRGGREE